MTNLDFDIGTFNLTSDNLVVGVGGQFDSTLNIDLGQTVNVTNMASVDPGSQLVVVGNFSSGGLTNGGLINVNNTTLTTTAGLVNNADIIDTTVEGPVNNAGGSTMTVLGTVNFNGMVSGPGNFFGPGIANFDGGMAPGASPAEVAFEGSIEFGSSNTLFIELGGLAGSEHDQVTVADTASLSGTLDVQLINGFAPAYNDTFTIMTYASRTNNVDSYSGVLLNPDMTLVPIASSTEFTLTAAPPGDGDLNGIVNFADFVLLANAFCQPDTKWGQGNFDLNGLTNFADFVILANHFGQTVPSNSEVHEPAAGVLMILGALVTVRAARRKSGRDNGMKMDRIQD